MSKILVCNHLKLLKFVARMDYSTCILCIATLVAMSTTKTESNGELHLESSMEFVENCSVGRFDYGGRLKCDGNETLIRRGYWFGNIREANVTVVGYCKFCKAQYSDNIGEYVSLAQYDQCSSNRTGLLCSKCDVETGPALNSRRFECIECNNSPAKMVGYVIGGLVQSFFLGGFLLIVSPATSGPMQSFVFISQVLTTVLQLDGDGTILINYVKQFDKVVYAYNGIYGIWNLQFVVPSLSICFSSSMKAIDVVALNFSLLLLFVVPIFVASFVTRICKKKHFCIKVLNSQGSLVASSVILVFMQVSITGFIFISPTYLYNRNGHIERKVLMYQGNIKYFADKRSIGYGFSGTILLILLLLFTLSMLLLRNKSESNISSTFRHRLNRFLNEYILTPFQGDFRSTEGSGWKIWKDCRWYMGWYFLLRLIFAATFVFSTNLLTQLIAQLIVCILAFIVSVVFRPYKYQLYNFWDASMLFILTLICALSLTWYCLFIRNSLHKHLLGLAVTKCIVVFVPALLAAVLSCVHIFQKIMKCNGGDPQNPRDPQRRWLLDRPAYSVNEPPDANDRNSSNSPPRDPEKGSLLNQPSTTLPGPARDDGNDKNGSKSLSIHGSAEQTSLNKSDPKRKEAPVTH